MDFQPMHPAEWQVLYEEARGELQGGRRAKVSGMFLGGAGVAMMLIVPGGAGTRMLVAVPGLGLGGFLYYAGSRTECEATETLADLERRKPQAPPTTMRFEFGDHRIDVSAGTTSSVSYTLGLTCGAATSFLTCAPRRTCGGWGCGTSRRAGRCT